MTRPSPAPEVLCPECGACVPGGAPGCKRSFEAVIAREFGDYRYGRLHRLTVDAYSLQHPGEYMRSGKSYAAHLTGICAALECDDAPAVNRSVRLWLDGPRVIERPGEPPPGKRGDLTISHVHGAAGPQEHLERVRQWACTVWSAWSAYHIFAREWIAQAGSRR